VSLHRLDITITRIKNNPPAIATSAAGIPPIEDAGAALHVPFAFQTPPAAVQAASEAAVASAFAEACVVVPALIHGAVEAWQGSEQS
jgi:hypothetical protein